MLRAIKIGDDNIRDNFRNQLSELQSDASKKDGIAGNDDSQEYPSKRSLACHADIIGNLVGAGSLNEMLADVLAIVGELGTPWDLKTKSGLLGMAKGKLHRSDYAEPAKVSRDLQRRPGGS